MKTRIYLLILIFSVTTIFLITNYTSAQVTQEWVARYNGPGNGIDVSHSMAIDELGNQYITGFSLGIGTDLDYTTIKYNSSGVEQWVARYNGPGNISDVGTAIAIDNSGNVYVTGGSHGNGTGSDYTTIKYNSSGIEQWVARYNGSGNYLDEATAIAIDNSGNVYITGVSYGNGSLSDYATVKYNSSGVEQWVARYNGSRNNYDQANAIAIDNSGNVYVTGYSYDTLEDYTTIKYNTSGVQQWLVRYNGPRNGYDIANAIVLDNSGNIYITGISHGSGTIGDYATIKYNTLGVQQWVARYNGPESSDDYAIAIAIDNSSNVYITGSSYGNGTMGDYATIKYNTSGLEQWVVRYNGPGNDWDEARDIAIDNSGNVYVTGYSAVNDTVSDYATIKYNSSGVQQWIERYKGIGNSDDVADAIAIDNSGNVYITGRSKGNGTNYDYATIKYSQTVGITSISSEIPKSFLLSQNYPNPFNPVTNIKFALPKSSFVSLRVFNTLGKEVAVLANENMQAGEYQANWDASGYTSGVYFYRLETDGFTETKKMLLVK